jgi:hypothetical protein
MSQQTHIKPVDEFIDGGNIASEVFWIAHPCDGT